MHKALKKHTYALKATKLAITQCGWLVVSGTPSAQMMKMQAISSADVLLYFHKLAISLRGKDKHRWFILIYSLGRMWALSKVGWFIWGNSLCIMLWACLFKSTTLTGYSHSATLNPFLEIVTLYFVLVWGSLLHTKMARSLWHGTLVSSPSFCSALVSLHARQVNKGEAFWSFYWQEGENKPPHIP